jgi:hypothetical protein
MSGVRRPWPVSMVLREAAWNQNEGKQAKRPGENQADEAAANGHPEDGTATEGDGGEHAHGREGEMT